MAVVAANLFPPNPANRFYEEDALTNRIKFQRIQTCVCVLTGSMAIALIVAPILKNAGSNAGWVTFAARNFSPGLFTTLLILGGGFLYTQRNLNDLRVGPKIDESNSLTRAQVTNFSSRMDGLEKVKLLDTTQVKKWKEELKVYLDRNGDCHYLGPKERERVKKMIEDFEAFESKLAVTTNTKAEIGSLLKKVQKWIREHRYAIENNKKPIIQAADPQISDDLKRCIDKLDPKAKAPAIIEIQDEWYQTLICLEVSLTALLKKVANEPPATRVTLNEETLALRKQFSDTLGDKKADKIKRDKIRAIIIRLLKGENVEPDGRMDDKLLAEWRSFALSAVKHAVSLEELERLILKISYSFLQDI